jgi:hypothetical protein
MLHWRLATGTAAVKRPLDWEHLLALTLQASSCDQSLRNSVGIEPPSQPALASDYRLLFPVILHCARSSRTIEIDDHFVKMSARTTLPHIAEQR